MVAAAAKKARPAICRWVPYVLVVVFSAGGAYFASRAAVDETATISYYNAVDSCERGNATLREPLHDFAAALARDYDNNIPAVTRAARETRDRTYPVDCLEVVEPVGPAGPYVPPAGR